MGIFSHLFKKKSEPAPVIEYPTYDVDDLQAKALLKFKEINDDYTMTKKEMIEWSWVDEKTYQYDFIFWVGLEKSEDKIKISAIDDNDKEWYLGRIADRDYESISKLLDSDSIDHTVLIGSGGKYKILRWQHIRKTDKDIYDLEKGEDDYSAKIEIHPIEVSADGNG